MKKYERRGESKVSKQRRHYGYVEGSTARKRAEYTETPRPELRHRRNYRIEPIPMNKGYIFVMIVAIVLVCIVLMSYVKLQSEMTNHISNISSLESELNDKKLANDETYTKIMSSVDLDEIKRIAVGELGMKYAKEGQVIEYEGEGNDYVRQYSDIPE
jgi:cell division protein FtsL